MSSPSTAAVVLLSSVWAVDSAGVGWAGGSSWGVGASWGVAVAPALPGLPTLGRTLILDLRIILSWEREGRYVGAMSPDTLEHCLCIY